MLMCCQLGSLWIDGDFESRQELQKLVFPCGILMNRENSNYRTENKNEVFKIMRLFSSNYKEEKQKATTENARLSPFVDTSYKLSNKFIEDFERIIEFIERRHIALQNLQGW